MAQDLSNKYFVKRGDGAWQDITTLWNGAKVLKISGLNTEGEAVNVYSEQWVNTDEGEDFLIAGDSIIRKTPDIEMTIIIGTRYGTNVNVMGTYAAMVTYMDLADFYIKSAYSKRIAHVVCLKGITPTVEKLQRGGDSYIMVTVSLHCLELPSFYN